MFPNPTSEWVNVQSSQPTERITLFDLNGKVVKMMNVGGELQSQLNMNDVPAGFYLMQITFSNNQTQNLKIIKK